MSRPKRTLQQIRESLKMSVGDLSDVSHISITAIQRIERHDPKGQRINNETAALLANALGVGVNEIEWPSALTHLGRTPLTGIEITTKTVRRTAKFCDRHGLELPATGLCDQCQLDE